MNYYVDSIAGNDANTGTLTSPWKTSTKVQSKMNVFVAGDQILFNCGGVYQPFIINTGGSSSGNITFGKYGTGNNPVISGFTTISSWINLGGGIFQSNPLTVGTSVLVLTINGIQYAMGRYPAANASNGGYINISAIGTNQLTSTGSLPHDFTGGTVVARTQHWRLDKATITSNPGNVINYTSMPNPPQVNWGFFVMNHPSCLANFGDWCFESATNTVKVFFGSNNPASYTTKVSTTDNIITVQSAYNVFDGLTIEGAGLDGITAQTAKTGNVVRNCTFQFIGADGIGYSVQTGAVITNNVFKYCNDHAVNCSYNNTNPVISNNQVTNIGIFAGMGKGGGYVGINSTTAATMTGNNIQNCGYCGIGYSGNTGNVITNNYVYNTCLITDDGGGIYGNLSAGSVPSNNVIDHNIVDVVKGNNYGTNYTGIPLAHCFYYDSAITGFTMSNNTGSNAAYSGSFFHGNSYFTAVNNTFYNCGFTQFLFQDAAGTVVTHGTMSGNILFSKAGQYAVYASHAGATTPDMVPGLGTFANNAYCRPANESGALTSNYSFNNHAFSLATWQSTYSIDSGSNITPSGYIDPTPLFLTNPTNAATSVALSGTYKDMFGTQFSGTVSIPAYGSKLLLNTATAAVPIIGYSPSTEIFTLNNPITAMTPNNTGGTPVSYSISPSLPVGLNFNTSTGVISGTPTALLSQTAFTVSAINGAGTGTATISLTVKPLIPAISYSPSSYTFIENVAISSISPVNTGGNPVSYAISPSLPTGLSFDTATGIISGNPSVISNGTTYTITATNSAGAGTAHINIAVNPAAPNISYSPNSHVYVMGVAISPIAPGNSGGNADSFSISPALPNGLNFNTATGAISGTPTTVSAITLYTITAGNVTGSSSTHLTLTVNPPIPAINYSPSSKICIQGIAIDQMAPISTGGNIDSYSISPSLPAGLNFDTATGIITGIPTIITGSTSYTVSATNNTGTGTAGITLTVNAKIPVLSYNPSAFNLTQNVGISIIGPINSGGIPVSYSISPSLPSGLSFNTSTGIISGTPTGTQSATTYTITANNTGGSAYSVITIAIAAPPAHIIIKKKFGLSSFFNFFKNLWH